MTKMEFSKEQKDAIETMGKNIIVSAAAGSGKTSVLVTRIIRLLIEDRKDIGSFIIVTFTNKASVEMKDRIRTALEEELKKKGSDLKFIKDQLKNLKHAQIKTLHSFCADMLRENFYYFDDLSPNFKVISENTATILKSNAIDEVFDKRYEQMDPTFENFLHNFASNKSDSGAKDIILKTYEKIMAEVRPIAWLDQATSEGFKLDKFKETVRGEMDQILDLARTNYDFTMGQAMRDKHQELIFDDFSQINDLTILLDEDWDKFIRKIGKIKFGRISKSKKDVEEDYSFIKDTRDLYKEDIKSVGKSVTNTDSLTMELFAKKEEDLLSEINILVKDFIKLYSRLKEEKAYLDFSDMEHKFIDLIDIEEARNKLRETYKHIFFDEYQDSNEIQNYIIEKLKGEDNLFFVGDVKQSIYGFRRAEPKLFLEKLEAYDKDEDSVRIDLNKNFRSQKEVLDFDNFIFDRLMTKEESDIDYKDGGHRLNFNKNEQSAYERANIKVIDSNIREEDYLAKLIEEIRTMGYDYRDIAILLRSGGKSYVYEEAFKKAEIPFFNDISKVSFRAVEVTFFINLLKYLANPKDDLTLLSILRSEIFDFDEDDLVEIRLRSSSYSFTKAFDEYDEDEEIVEKINDFKTTFADLTYVKNLLSLYEFANYVFEKTGFYEYLLARDRASDRINNVESFIDIMDEYDRTNDNGLFGLLDFVDSLSMNQSDNIQTTRELSEAEDLVRIMTIHKSKGLEFPVVILADTGKRFNNKHLREPIVFDDDLGIGINLSDYENKLRFSSLRKNLINDKITKENKKEEMRILYVAMTRAEEMLFITGERNLKTLGKLKGRIDFLNMNTYMDWILSIISRDKVSEELFEDHETNDLDGLASLEVIEESDPVDKFESKDMADFLESRDVNQEIYNKLREIFDSPYPYEDQTRESIKRSVTEISKDFDPSLDGYRLPNYEENELAGDFRKANFIREEKSYKAVDKGTIIHKLFQALDFKDYDKDSLEEEIDRLIREKRIEEDSKDLVELDKILGFFEDPFIKDLSQKATNIRKEESFLMTYEDYYVNGQIDLMFEINGKAVLVDFKTDRTKRESLYDKQIQIYRQAIEKSLGKKVETSLIYWYNFKEFTKIE